MFVCVCENSFFNEKLKKELQGEQREIIIILKVMEGRQLLLLIYDVYLGKEKR